MRAVGIVVMGFVFSIASLSIDEAFAQKGKRGGDRYGASAETRKNRPGGCRERWLAAGETPRNITIKRLCPRG